MQDPLRPTSSARKPLERWLAWLLLGALSVFFAEVSGGRAPLAFLNIYGLLVTLPLYTLHLLVLAPLVIERGRPVTFSTLYLAGTIFGLYEAYITKALWSPLGQPEAWRLGGVAVQAVVALVLCWHPLMAFILPLLTGGRLLGDRKTLPLLLPARLARRFQPAWLALPGATLGVLHGAACGSPGAALLSAAFAVLLVLGLTALTRRAAGGRSLSFPDLLPTLREWRVLAMLLLAGYLALGLVVRRDALPDFPAQLSVWGLYALFGGLLWLARRTARVATDAPPAPKLSIPVAPVQPARAWLWFGLGFISLSTLAGLLPVGAADAVYFLAGAAAVPAGLFLLGRALLPILPSRLLHHARQSPGRRTSNPS